MCGRYVQVTEPKALGAFFDAEVSEQLLPAASDRSPAATPSYNVAPTMQVPAVLRRDDARRLGPLTWGFVPFWSKNPKRPPRPINARLDGVRTNNMFRPALAGRRCLLPADGFYEWQLLPDDTKQPWFIHHPDDEPLALAGIWSSWREKLPEDADREPDRLWSAAIVTTDAAGPVMPQLHDRMPVVLPASLWDRWLDVDRDATDEELDDLVAAVAGLGEPPLTARRVSTQVNDVRNDDPANVAPLPD